MCHLAGDIVPVDPILGSFLLQKLEEQGVGVADAPVCDSPIDGPTEPKDLPQGERNAPPHRGLAIQVADHELSEHLELLDNLPGGKTSLRRSGSEQLRRTCPELFCLVAKGTQDRGEKRRHELYELFYQAVPRFALTRPIGVKALRPLLP